MATSAAPASSPATNVTEQNDVHHDKTATTIEIAAPKSRDNHRGVPPQTTSATPASDSPLTAVHDNTSAIATPSVDAIASTPISADAAENPTAVLPMSGDGADDTKDKAPAAGDERDIQDGCQSSAERNMWSVFNPMWNIFVVNKARLPKKADRGADWAGAAGRPDGLHKFLGTKNPVNRKTVGFLRRCIEEKLVTQGILLCGLAGSGKSALIKAFLSEFMERFASNPEAVARLYKTRVLDVTQDLDGPPKRLAGRVKRFFAAKKDRLSDIVPRFVVVDGIESVPSKSQSTLMTLIESAAPGGFSSQGGVGDSGGGDTGGAGAPGGSSAGVRMMLTTRDASKLTVALRKCVKPFKVELVDEVDGVRIFLRILQREKVGFELLAVKAIFRMHWPDLQRCIAVANEVFCEKEFLSEENTLKVIAPKSLAAREERSHHIEAANALEPLDLCRACTLRPPCRHISEQELASRGMRRRAELPQRRVPEEGQRGAGGEGGDSVDCQAFVRRGACRVFNERGHCSNHHPLDAHVVEVPRPRCPQCTIRLPCGHCDYDHSRRGLETFCEVAGARIEKRISRLHRLLKGGAAAAQRAAAVKASAEASDDPLPLDGVQGGTGGTVAVSGVQPPSPGASHSGLHLSPATAAAVPSKSNPKSSTFSGRANEINSRGVQAAAAKLGALGGELEAARAWAVDDRKPEGGMHEFREAVFDKKLDRLFRRCEEAHDEADAVSEAYILLLDRVR